GGLGFALILRHGSKLARDRASAKGPIGPSPCSFRQSGEPRAQEADTAPFSPMLAAPLLANAAQARMLRASHNGGTHARRRCCHTKPPQSDEKRRRARADGAG